jgi:hypothetical protein
VTDHPGVSSSVWRHLCLCLDLNLLVRGLDCSGVLLDPLCADAGKTSSTNTSEYDRYEVRRYATLHRFPKHRVLNFALLQLQALLPRPLLLLPSSFFFSLCRQPILHAILSTLPLRRSWR